MSARSVLEHALTVYLDGNADVAVKAVDQFAESVRTGDAQRIAELEAEVARLQAALAATRLT